MASRALSRVKSTTFVSSTIHSLMNGRLASPYSAFVAHTPPIGRGLKTCGTRRIYVPTEAPRVLAPRHEHDDPDPINHDYLISYSTGHPFSTGEFERFVESCREILQNRVGGQDVIDRTQPLPPGSATKKLRHPDSAQIPRLGQETLAPATDPDTGYLCVHGLRAQDEQHWRCLEEISQIGGVYSIDQRTNILYRC